MENEKPIARLFDMMTTSLRWLEKSLLIGQIWQQANMVQNFVLNLRIKDRLFCPIWWSWVT